MLVAAKLKQGDTICFKGEEKTLGRIRRIYPKAGTGVYQFIVDAEVDGEEDHLQFQHTDNVLLVCRKGA